MKNIITYGFATLVTLLSLLLGFNAYKLYQKHGLITEVLGIIGIISSIVLIALALLPSVKIPHKDTDSSRIKMIRKKYENKRQQ